MKPEITDMFLRLEQRITNIENFINSVDFSKLKPCKHESDGHSYVSGNILAVEGFIYKCIHCGEFYR